MAPLRPIPDTAFGFVLDDEFRRRWAQAKLDENRDSPDLKGLDSPPGSLLHSAMMTMISTIPEEVYDAVPGLPCLQPYLLPVKEHGLLLPPGHYVFVLQEDDRTLPPTPENVELVREALGLGKNVQPVWVPIYRCVEHECLGGAPRALIRGPEGRYREMC